MVKVEIITIPRLAEQLTKPYLIPTTVNSDAQTPSRDFLVSPHGRGLAWAITGFSEELEFISILTNEELEPYGGKESLTNTF